MRFLKVILSMLMVVVILDCHAATRKVIISGRTQKILVEDKLVLDMSTQQCQELLKNAKFSTNATNTAMVKRVGMNIINAVVGFFNNNGLGNEINNVRWSFILIQDRQAKACCMPGGQVIVSEGLLPVTQDEASLAIVLGHEIAHTIAHHSAELLSSEIKKWKIGNSPDISTLVSTATANGFTLWDMSYSLEQEKEADYIGMIFAAMAGYDPQTAVSLSQRMAAVGTNMDETRINQINKSIPIALTYYKPSKPGFKQPSKITSSSSATQATAPPLPSKDIQSSKSTPKRIALIIGNADYKSSNRLANPENDAVDFATKLKSLGFVTIVRTNLKTQREMKQEIASFCDKASSYDETLFYYAGHAIQHEEVNYLKPTNPGEIINEADIEDKYVSFPWIIRSIQNAHCKSNIIILDACRDEPSTSYTRSDRRGLANLTQMPKGFVWAFSTQPGDVAQDGIGQRNSPYMTAILQELDSPMQKEVVFFDNVKSRVQKLTDKKQIPVSFSNLENSFYFNLNK